MSDLQEKSKSHLHTLSFLGPASVVLSVLLLVINDSPFYIDFSACAMLGLVLCWRFKLKGLALSSLLLASLLSYEYFYHPAPVTLWDVGIAASVFMAFVVTSLTSLEFMETLRSYGSLAATEIKSWETKLEESLSGRRKLETTIRDLEDKLTGHASELKAKKESSEFFERLLQIARDELLQQTALKEKFENDFFQEKSRAKSIEESLTGLHVKHEDVQKVLKEKIALQTEALSEHQEKIKHLTDELGKLTDRLKGVESEKEEIEKALEEALAPNLEETDPKTSKDFAKMQGLYQQLRSQFEEKSLILDQTRAELFQAKESISALDISSKESDFDHHNLWSIHVRQLSMQINALELEIALLEELVFKDHHPL